MNSGSASAFRAAAELPDREEPEDKYTGVTFTVRLKGEQWMGILDCLQRVGEQYERECNRPAKMIQWIKDSIRKQVYAQ